MSLLEVKNLSVRYGDCVIVDNVSFTLNEGEWLMLVGPNGAGKSTIVNAVTGGAPFSGEIMLDGTDINRMKPDAIARAAGVLAQSHAVGYGFSVEEVVRLGRYAWSRALGTSAEDDTEHVESALELTGMKEFRRQSVLTLSGGELQRTFLAQLIAQNPRLLILDEPSNHLDLVYQKQVFSLITDWLKTPGRAVMSVVHDLSLAKAFGSEAVLLNRGRVSASGAIAEVLTRERLAEVYEMDVYAYLGEMLGQWR